MMPKIEDRLTICASRCFDRIGRNARVPCTVPQKLMLNSQSICACSISLNEPSNATPALLTTMFSFGCAALAAAAKSAIWPASPTSTRCVVTLRGCALAISAATDCSPASSRSASARSQPRAANSSARARPMPLAAPVMAAADPLIAVIRGQLHRMKKRAGECSIYLSQIGTEPYGGFDLNPRWIDEYPFTETTDGTIKAVPRDRTCCRERPDAAGDDLPAAGGKRHGGD